MAVAAGCLGCDRPPPPQVAAKRAAAERAPIGADKTQLVAVVSADWSDFRAALHRYERDPSADGTPRWKPVGKPLEVVLGRAGYGWGRGLHGGGRPTGRPGPLKREGDLRSPAGVFEIGTAYGYAPSRPDLTLPYVQATPGLRCVDDSQSAYYNQIVSTTDTEVDWQSAEHMRRDDELYVLAIVVEHNTRDMRRGAGSCIFIHLWNGPGEGMTGCTAMPLDALNELAAWLRPGASVLVALPRSEYEALKRPWDLPALRPVSQR